jgi:hypothetical protein
LTELEQKAQALLFQRQQAYRLVFDSENQFTKAVLKDLSDFCRANESTFHSDPRVAAMMDGRREVWLRIERLLTLSQEELWENHKKRKRQG